MYSAKKGGHVLDKRKWRPLTQTDKIAKLSLSSRGRALGDAPVPGPPVPVTPKAYSQDKDYNLGPSAPLSVEAIKQPLAKDQRPDMANFIYWVIYCGIRQALGDINYPFQVTYSRDAACRPPHWFDVYFHPMWGADEGAKGTATRAQADAEYLDDSISNPFDQAAAFWAATDKLLNAGGDKEFVSLKIDNRETDISSSTSLYLPLWSKQLSDYMRQHKLGPDDIVKNALLTCQTVLNLPKTMEKLENARVRLLSTGLKPLRAWGTAPPQASDHPSGIEKVVQWSENFFFKSIPKKDEDDGGLLHHPTPNSVLYLAVMHLISDKLVKQKLVRKELLPRPDWLEAAIIDERRYINWRREYYDSKFEDDVKYDPNAAADFRSKESFWVKVYSFLTSANAIHRRASTEYVDDADRMSKIVSMGIAKQIQDPLQYVLQFMGDRDMIQAIMGYRPPGGKVTLAQLRGVIHQHKSKHGYEKLLLGSNQSEESTPSPQESTSGISHDNYMMALFGNGAVEELNGSSSDSGLDGVDMHADADAGVGAVVGSKRKASDENAMDSYQAKKRQLGKGVAPGNVEQEACIATMRWHPDWAANYSETDPSLGFAARPANFPWVVSFEADNYYQSRDPVTGKLLEEDKLPVFDATSSGLIDKPGDDKQFRTGVSQPLPPLVGAYFKYDEYFYHPDAQFEYYQKIMYMVEQTELGKRMCPPPTWFDGEFLERLKYPPTDVTGSGVADVVRVEELGEEVDPTTGHPVEGRTALVPDVSKPGDWLDSTTKLPKFKVLSYERQLENVVNQYTYDGITDEWTRYWYNIWFIAKDFKPQFVHEKRKKKRKHKSFFKALFAGVEYLGKEAFHGATEISKFVSGQVIHSAAEITKSIVGNVKRDFGDFNPFKSMDKTAQRIIFTILGIAVIATGVKIAMLKAGAPKTYASGSGVGGDASADKALAPTR